MTRKIPGHPERICWGCAHLCAANDMRCGADRTQHPIELWGEDWMEIGLDSTENARQSKGDKLRR
jgi:hypothetical protein